MSYNQDNFHKLTIDNNKLLREIATSATENNVDVTLDQ